MFHYVQHYKKWDADNSLNEYNMENFSIDITYNYSNLQTAYNLHFNKLYPIKSKLLWLFSILLIIVGIMLCFINKQLETSMLLGVVYIILGVISLCYCFWIYKTMGKRMFKKMPDFSNEFHYDFSNDGINIKSKTICTDVKWEYYKHAIISDDMILLYPNKLKFNIFPKRNFSNEQYNCLADKIKSKIDDCKVFVKNN